MSEFEYAMSNSLSAKAGPAHPTARMTMWSLVAVGGPVGQIDSGYPALRLEFGKAGGPTSNVDDDVIGARPNQRTVGLVAPAPRTFGEPRPEPAPDAPLAVSVDSHPGQYFGMAHHRCRLMREEVSFCLRSGHFPRPAPAPCRERRGPAAEVGALRHPVLFAACPRAFPHSGS